MWLNVLTAPPPHPWVHYPSQMTQTPLASAATSRIRVNSESQASAVSREEELQGNGEDEAGTPTDGAPFRGRSRSAPPALWAAKKYGRQLRRMSDEFDSLLDKGVSGAKAKSQPPFKAVLVQPLCFPRREWGRPKAQARPNRCTTPAAGGATCSATRRQRARTTTTMATHTALSREPTRAPGGSEMKIPWGGKGFGTTRPLREVRF